MTARGVSATLRLVEASKLKIGDQYQGRTIVKVERIASHTAVRLSFDGTSEQHVVAIAHMVRVVRPRRR